MSRRKEKQTLNSVGLVGDGDDVDLLKDFENIFEISISDDEAANMDTLGQAFEIICSKLPTNEEKETKCLSAMAYFRLNSAFAGQKKTRPSVRLEKPRDLSPRDFQKHLETKSGLKLEFLTRRSSFVEILLFMQSVTWIVAPILFSGLTAVFAGFLIVTASHVVWRVAERNDKRVWVFEGTIADLSRQASEANLGKLISLGGNWNEFDVWTSMTSIIHAHTGFPPDHMTPDTKFI